jgi:hypothetical protein
MDLLDPSQKIAYAISHFGGIAPLATGDDIIDNVTNTGVQPIHTVTDIRAVIVMTINVPWLFSTIIAIPRCYITY